MTVPPCPYCGLPVTEGRHVGCATTKTDLVPLRGRYVAKGGTGDHPTFRWIDKPDQAREDEFVDYVEGVALRDLLDLEEAQGR